ncbi:alpha/beta fold hydrolase [Oceanicaulis sp. LC35]|uniref:bifunctional alpha/beta hydrolase/OsmC family protein n=1 Tax=Oceanicaulis sp. LC35 TaxID=3349635 RepID=UPI003F8559E4
MAQSEKVTFEGAAGDTLAARLDRPNGPIRAWALFAHCFSCSKDVHAAQRVSRRLTTHGYGVLRFDFTGLGQSEGDFANTNFSSNVEDLIKAADFLRETQAAPSLLVGHSLGGAAVIAAAPSIPEVKAVATLNAPADAEHVRHHFSQDEVEAIEANGSARVSLAGRVFTIKKQFLDDIEDHKLEDVVRHMKAALLIAHSPIDETVGIENATRLFVAARHPKSFLSLDNADHLLSREADSHYAADAIAAWASRYAPPAKVGPPPQLNNGETAIVQETGLGGFHSWAVTGEHAFIVDEPEKVGGLNGGPAPYDMLSAALGACTTMTLRMYANHKQIELGRITTRVTHSKVKADGPSDLFEREIEVEGLEDEALQLKLLEIANKCPVHRTLERGAHVESRYKGSR